MSVVSDNMNVICRNYINKLTHSYICEVPQRVAYLILDVAIVDCGKEDHKGCRFNKYI